MANKVALQYTLLYYKADMEYYIEIDKEKRGPYSLSELAERNLQATTLVMPAEGTQWVPAWQVEELRAILEGKNPADVERQPQEVSFVEATPIEQTAQQENTVQQQNSPKKNQYWLPIEHSDSTNCPRCSTDHHVSKARTAQGCTFWGSSHRLSMTLSMIVQHYW